jgi:hypothetical protein
MLLDARVDKIQANNTHKGFSASIYLVAHRCNLSGEHMKIWIFKQINNE